MMITIRESQRLKRNYLILDKYRYGQLEVPYWVGPTNQLPQTAVSCKNGSGRGGGRRSEKRSEGVKKTCDLLLPNLQFLFLPLSGSHPPPHRILFGGTIELDLRRLLSQEAFKTRKQIICIVIFFFYLLLDKTDYKSLKPADLRCPNREKRFHSFDCDALRTDEIFFFFFFGSTRNELKIFVDGVRMLFGHLRI